VAQMTGLAVFGPDGRTNRKVFGTLVAGCGGPSPPRVLGLVVELITRQRIFVPMLRVTAIDPAAVHPGAPGCQPAPVRPAAERDPGGRASCWTSAAHRENRRRGGRGGCRIEPHPSQDWVIGGSPCAPAATRLAGAAHVQVMDWSKLTGLSLSGNRPGRRRAARGVDGMRAADVAAPYGTAGESAAGGGRALARRAARRCVPGVTRSDQTRTCSLPGRRPGPPTFLEGDGPDDAPTCSRAALRGVRTVPGADGARRIGSGPPPPALLEPHAARPDDPGTADPDPDATRGRGAGQGAAIQTCCQRGQPWSSSVDHRPPPDRAVLGLARTCQRLLRATVRTRRGVLDRRPGQAAPGRAGSPRDPVLRCLQPGLRAGGDDNDHLLGAVT